jgi:cytochrome P450
MWVAASARDVQAVLTSERCRVRPPAEPVPRAIAGTAAGSVFGRLVRMNDGPAHAAARRIVVAALGSAGPLDVRATSRHLARVDTRDHPPRLMDLAFDVPARVMAVLLGVHEAHLDAVVGWAGDFVRGIAAGAGDDAIARGAEAAARLEDTLERLPRERTTGLLERLARAAERAGGPAPAIVVANAIGFLSQPYEATAGLIGNAALALARAPALRDHLRAEVDLVPVFIQEVLRHDPPVHNTRRFVAESGEVAGAELQAGDAILVVLAAAQRDPALNPDPDTFRLDRGDRRTLAFGSGPHACPGDRLADAIACGVIDALLEMELDLPGAPAGYLPLGNVRIPVFQEDAAAR